MMTLSEMVGFVKIKTDKIADLWTLIVEGSAPLSNMATKYSATVASELLSGCIPFVAQKAEKASHCLLYTFEVESL